MGMESRQDTMLWGCFPWLLWLLCIKITRFSHAPMVGKSPYKLGKIVVGNVDENGMVGERNHA
jgi:hypothetical protein